MVEDVLRRHEEGERDFERFCDEMGEGGIYKWDMDIEGGSCSYMELEEEGVI
ncbi:DUF1398 family protein [Staphylococcus aureus]|uniref:DUF1398 family protein n=1 Tax=Staphylococcus aureus TaxID=1280 RepID=UPI0011A193BC|nr:DUF1398 family protein [Staphylococcus aureus]